jgi:polyhydroxyalkanoate synthesis regulator phasin
MKEKINNFIRCSNKLDAITKSTFKNPEIDVLFCIIQDEIFVHQGLKLINVNLEQFAEGLNIDIIEAQAIVSGGAETIAEARKIIKESIEGFEVTIEESNITEVVQEDLQDGIKEKVEKVTDVVKEKVHEQIDKVQTLAKSGVELLVNELLKRIEELEARVAKLEPKEIEKPLEEVVESEQVDEDASQKREE